MTDCDLDIRHQFTFILCSAGGSTQHQPCLCLTMPFMLVDFKQAVPLPAVPYEETPAWQPISSAQ